MVNTRAQAEQPTATMDTAATKPSDATTSTGSQSPSQTEWRPTNYTTPATPDVTPPAVWELLLANLQRLNDATFPQQEEILPIFSGRPEEDPRVFLEELEYTFAQRKTPERLSLKMAFGQLRDQAAEAFPAERFYAHTWGSFKADLVREFAAPSVIGRHYAVLFGEPQPSNEAAHVFLDRKMALARRLVPSFTDEHMLPVLLDQLQQPVRSRMCAPRPSTLLELRTWARDIEEDLRAAAASRRTTATGKTKEPPTEPPTPAPRRTTAEFPPPPCHHCPDRHFHRDCPVLREKWRSNIAQGNDSGAGRR